MPDEKRTPSREEVLEREEFDNPDDRSVGPVEPRCAMCGRTFASDAELLDHAKTCKGGRARAARAHSR
jgi:hypothetical protein